MSTRNSGSTPLLAPEFRNPLFLKTLCQGLNVKGERRLPRGFHGITAMFDLYLTMINTRLASALDFDAKTPLVRLALEAVSEAMLDGGERWLARTKANGLVVGPVIAALFVAVWEIFVSSRQAADDAIVAAPPVPAARSGSPASSAQLHPPPAP